MSDILKLLDSFYTDEQYQQYEQILMAVKVSSSNITRKNNTTDAETSQNIEFQALEKTDMYV